jgi:hypothetical protein
VLPSAGGILGGITIGVGMGLGMGNLGSGGGSGNLDTGEGGSVRDTGGDVLHGFVSMNRNSADLGSDSSALGHCNGLRCDFLCASGSKASALSTTSRKHATTVLAKTTMP